MKQLFIAISTLSAICFTANSSYAQSWAKTYGGTAGITNHAIQQTSDEGYILVGGYGFIWLMKLDAYGDFIWKKTYDGNKSDNFSSMQQTSDGGYIVAGDTTSFGAGSSDIWLLKLDSNGNITWQKTYGGSSSDYAYSIHQTLDGGYIVVGDTYSFGGSSRDLWLFKLDSNGGITWQKTYGGSDIDYARSIQQTTDEGYIVVGYTRSFGAGNYDFWVFKVDGDGNMTWQKTYGGSDFEYARSILQTTDGGYIVAGYTNSYGVGLNTWLLKLDSNGDITWQKTYGGYNSDRVHSIQQTSDEGYIVGGDTMSFHHYPYAKSDSWAFKLDDSGNIVWEYAYYGGLIDDSAESIEQTTDGGYILTGLSENDTRRIRVLKLNNDGLIPNCDIAKTTAAIITDTSAIPQDTTANVLTSSAIITATDVTPQDTLSEVLDCPPFDNDTDNDGMIDIEDNCPYDYNPNQEDTFPPQGNSIGNACDCEANFDCNCGVDALDVAFFIVDMGRNQYFNPCTKDNPCNGDFACDGAVDASDVVKFLEDFGR